MYVQYITFCTTKRYTETALKLDWSSNIFTKWYPIQPLPLSRTDSSKTEKTKTIFGGTVRSFSIDGLSGNTPVQLISSC